MIFPLFSPRRLGGCLCTAAACLLAMPAYATNVTMHTPFGDVEIELFDEAAPVTVANFLQYVNDGSYVNSFIHRSDPDFVIQGGGYYFDDGSPIAIQTRDPIENEAGISNDRGTIAMAKMANAPDSATSQWFFNLENNAAELDDANGGYTVFGQVLGNGMDVIDQIADLKVWNAGSPFNELPLIDYPGPPTPVTDQHLVMIEIEVESDGNGGFVINQGLNDTWYYTGTDGQGFFIIVYPEIQSMFLSWFTFDTERPDESVTAMLGDPGHRWLTAQGSYAGNEAALDVYITSGGVFDSGTPELDRKPDGTIVVEFSGCNEGMVTYDIPSIDRQGVVPIERVFADSDNLAHCEELAAAGAEAR